MSRKHEKIKTKYLNIYEIDDTGGQKNYIANFNYQGKRYGDRNLTKLFGVKTALQAFNKLHEIKVLISSGENPFLDDSLKVDDLITRYFSQLKSENSRSKYVEIHSYVYSKHIKPIIGHLFIDKVTPEHINRIIHNMRTQSLSSASIRKVKTILNPIFQEAFLNENIKRNILNLAKFVKKGSGISAKGSKEILTQRLEEPLENAVKKLFQSKAFLKMSINGYNDC